MTTDDLDDPVDALTDEHVTSRLHDVLARAFAARLPEMEGAPTAEGRTWSADSTEMQDLTDRVEATQRRLRSVQASLRDAEIRRDDMMRSVAFAERRIDTAKRRVIKVVPEDDAYLETILDLAREILDGAHDTAGHIIADARAEAQGIIAAAERRAGRLSQHRG